MTKKDELKELFMNNQDKIYTSVELSKIINKVDIIKELKELEKEKLIANIYKDFYSYLYYSSLVKEYSYPSPSKLAYKIAEIEGFRISEGEDRCLNLVGLSTQVPSHYIFSASTNRDSITYRNREISFKQLPGQLFKENEYITIFLIALNAVKDKLNQKNIARLKMFLDTYIKEEEIIDIPGDLKIILDEYFRN